MQRRQIATLPASPATRRLPGDPRGERSRAVLVGLATLGAVVTVTFGLWMTDVASSTGEDKPQTIGQSQSLHLTPR